ncbi:MAG: hypothetical protein H0M93_04405 [Methanophagales archaeon]|nr:hypothetical protein [Methanophagales archaeon]
MVKTSLVSMDSSFDVLVEYIYEVTWDREKNEQVWNYQGKVARDFETEKFKDEIKWFFID